jgi:hypothetical protein
VGSDAGGVNLPEHFTMNIKKQAVLDELQKAYKIAEEQSGLDDIVAARYLFDLGRAITERVPDGGTFTDAHAADIGDEILRGIDAAVEEARDNAVDIANEIMDRLRRESHKLVILSLHDAQAECEGCEWHFTATGELSRAEIEDEFSKSHA